MQQLQHLVGGAIFTIPFLDVNLEIGFGGDGLTLLASRHDLFGAHAATFSGEINPLARALGDITGGITHQGHATHHPAGTGMLGDWVGLYLDHFAIEQALFSPFPDALLQTLNQGLVLLHGAGAHSYVVVFREHPGVEIWRHIGSDIHFGQVFVILHLFGWQLNPLLESNRHVVIASIHRLGNAAIGPIGANDQINGQFLGNTSGFTGAVIGVMEGIGALALGAGINFGNQTIHQVGAQACGSLAQVGIHHFAATHADVFVLIFKIDVHLAIGGGNHFHIAYFSINNRFRQIKLLHHAQGNGAPAGFGIVEFSLEDPGFDSGLGQNFCSTRTAWAAAHHCDTQHFETGFPESILSPKLTPLARLPLAPWPFVLLLIQAFETPPGCLPSCSPCAPPPPAPVPPNETVLGPRDLANWTSRWPAAARWPSRSAASGCASPC